MKKVSLAALLLACMTFVGCNGLLPMQSSTPQASTPNASTPADSTPGDTTPDDSTPDNSTPDDSTPDDGGLDGACVHADNDKDTICDECGGSVVVTLDFYAVNDLHGKLTANDSQPGVGGLTTYLKEAKSKNPNTVLLSSGDMWQGGSESNLTRGMIVNDWMSEMDFVSMTLGNHEFDWGTSYIAQNAAASEFAYLAINVYEHATNSRAPYCQPSVMIERGGAKIGVIGAIGDCYSSISSDKVKDVYFKTGNELTNLVKAEANRLKAAGADCIVYSIHDGTSGYDNSLSNGYVDVVFEGHTHSRYVSQDTYGVYHLQGGGENRNISHATLNVNVVENSVVTKTAETISNYVYGEKANDPLLQSLLNKYKDQIALGTQLLGYNARYRDDSELEQLVAELYLKAGLERWGSQYNIVLGGGFLRTRSPYNLAVGNVLYSDVQTLFTFDNPLVLCKISGHKLKTKFIQTTSEDYYVSYSQYGQTVKNSIDTNAIYYVVVDSYTSQYTSNGLTEIARYDETTFARDLLADYIRAGGLAT